LGGPNFAQLPINRPAAPVNDNQRDGYGQQAIHTGRVAYSPNSVGGGCPFASGDAGYVHHPLEVGARERLVRFRRLDEIGQTQGFQQRAVFHRMLASA
jgi:catalase